MNCLAGVVWLDGGLADAHALARPMAAMAHGDTAPHAAIVRGAAVFGCQTGSAHPALQPDVLARGDLLVVADARIDDRVALCRRLGLSHAAADEASDVDLILASYERWGAACTDHLIGDYAFAVWDQSRHALFCARDHIGARPFYYAQIGERFMFATEIAGVLAFDGVPAHIDEAEVARYLVNRIRAYREPAHTFFTHVYKLQFGYRLTNDAGRIREDRHWRPEQLPDLTYPTRDDYAPRLFELVSVAVNERLRGAQHIGVHLSGGLDSSSLAVMASRTSRERGLSLTPFSWSPPPSDNLSGPEYARIATVARAAGLTPRYVPYQPSDAWQFHHDIALEPRRDTLAERPVVAAAAAQGVDVMMSGWGGDEAASYNGRGIAAGYLGTGRWHALARHCWQRGGVGRPMLRRLGGGLSTLWHEACVPWLPDPVFRMQSSRGVGARASLIAPHFLARIRPHVRPPTMSARDVPGGRANLLNLYFCGALADRIDCWRMFRSKHDVTYVYPLTDRRVLEFIYSAPPELHVQRGRPRSLFRKAMTPVVPTELLSGGTKIEGRREWFSRFSFADQVAEHLTRLEVPGSIEPHPWVDMMRLREALMGAQTDALPSVPIDHALSMLTIWSHWGAAER